MKSIEFNLNTNKNYNQEINLSTVKIPVYSLKLIKPEGAEFLFLFGDKKNRETNSIKSEKGIIYFNRIHPLVIKAINFHEDDTRVNIEKLASPKIKILSTEDSFLGEIVLKYVF